MARLKDRVAVITGAAHGIGRGIALAYAREGAKVVVNDQATDLSTGHAEEVAKLIAEAGGEAEIFQGDASDSADMQRVLASTVERFGRIDILVNNANPGRRDPSASREFLHHTEEHVVQGYLLPFKAAYFNTQMAAKQMIAQGGGGTVITITSVHQERAWGWDSIYGPMKAALRRLVMSQARELAPHKIRVNCIAPGFIDNRLYRGRARRAVRHLQRPRRDRDPARPRQAVRHRRGGPLPRLGRRPLRDRHLHPGRRRHAAAPDHRDLGAAPTPSPSPVRGEGSTVDAMNCASGPWGLPRPW